MITIFETFNKKRGIGLIHKVYNAQLKNVRNYLASTKTKSEVRGGGRKPWRQKGTGNARAGSIRSSIWVGGGVSFGPKPRLVKKKINKKEKKLALYSALILKKREIKIFSSEAFEIIKSSQKTKDIIKFLDNIDLSFIHKKILIVLPLISKNLLRCTKNLKNIQIILSTSLNVKIVLESEIILFPENNLSYFTNFGNILLF